MHLPHLPLLIACVLGAAGAGARAAPPAAPKADAGLPATSKADAGTPAPAAAPLSEVVAPGSGRPYAMRISQAHPFAKEEARARLHFLLDYWTQRFGVRQQWLGDTVLVTGWVLGIRVEARVQVDGQRVWALAVDPGPIMRGSAENYIRRKIAKYMHPTYQEP